MDNSATAVLAIAGLAVLAFILIKKPGAQTVTLYPNLDQGNAVVYTGVDKSLAEALASILDKVSAVWWWDEAAQAWRAYSPTAPDWANDLTLMLSGETYYIYVTAECIWNTAGD